MNNEPDDPRSEWDPLGWELEGPAEQSSDLPVPRAAEVVAWVPPDVPPYRSRNPATSMLVASVLLAVFGLVGIGIGVGSVFFNQDIPPPEVVVVSGPQVVSASPGQSPALQAPLVVPPTVQPPSDQFAEPAIPVVPVDPVVEVARAVIPSVVLIEVGDFGLGSGIIYDASGLILTNAHVVDEAEVVRVQFADGTRAEGIVVGTAPAIDVALVRVDTDIALTPAVFADRSTVEVGQLAVAVGSPFGFQQSVTSGIVSAIGRPVRGDGRGALVEMIQTDAPINVGNSGGALANRFGHVIGMNTLIQTDGSTVGSIGLGFAIPSDTVLNIAHRILGGKSTELGFLGITGITSETGHPGAEVVEVTPDSPAGRAGVMVGDLIVLIDNETVSTMGELVAKVQFRAPGTEVELEVLRDTEHITLSVIIGALSVEEPDEESEE